MVLPFLSHISSHNPQPPKSHHLPSLVLESNSDGGKNFSRKTKIVSGNDYVPRTQQNLSFSSIIITGSFLPTIPGTHTSIGKNLEYGA